MNAASLRQQLRKYWWLVAVSVCVLLYTVAGFLLLPYSLKQILTVSLAKQWGHPVKVQAVSFNPYRLYLQVDGFSVEDADGSPLLALEQLRFDYEALSALRMEVGIEEFAIEKPFVKLEADGKGSYTLLNMFASPEQKPAEPENKGEKTGEIIPLLLRSVSMRNGTILYRDKDRAGGFEQTVNLPALSILDFHTRKTASGNHVALALSNQKGATLDIDANVRLVPLRIAGTVALNHLNLAPIWQLLALPVNFAMQSPTLDVSAKVDATVSDALSLKLTEGSLRLTNLAIADKNAPDQPQIRLPSLAVSDISLTLPQQQVNIGNVTLADGWANVVLARDGSNNLQTLFAQPQPQPQPQPSAPDPAATPAAQPTPESVPKAAPWDVTLQQVSLENFSVQLRDEHPATPMVLNIAPIGIAINTWKPLSPDPFNVQLRATVAGPAASQVAQLAVDTRLQLSPLSVGNHIDLQGFPLSLVQPYVHDGVRADIDAGALSATLDVDVTSAEKLSVVAKGKARVDGLDVHEKGRNKKLLSWDSVAVEGIHFDLAGNALELGTITIDKLNGGFIINPDGTTNIHDLMVPKPASPPSSAPMKMKIGKIALQDADLGFADLTMKPNFRVAMKHLSGSVDGLSTDPKTMATIDLKGKVDRYAPVTIKGKLNPLLDKPKLDARLAFKNLELTTFTPYSGTYAGFKIDKGQLSLDIDYKLVNNKIQGKNHIVMNQLQLGETVESSKAVTLPLRLAIALLRDENGVIDLGFEVGGDLNDPQFSISGILWKVLSNMVMKVVTSPFSLVSGLMGGEEADGIDQIHFAAGQDAVDEAAKAKLEKAAQLLAKRSSLHINIQGNAQPEQDKPALQRQKLLATLQEQSKGVPPEAFASGQSAPENGDAYKVLARYYKKQRNDELGDVIDRIRDDGKARGETLERERVKQLAYEQAWQRLQDDVPVSDEELQQLAMQRGRNIKAVLVEQLAVAAERVFVIDANTDPAKASLDCHLTLDAH